MRTRIAVTGLTTGQVNWLRSNLPADREFAPDSVRMCVEFETGMNASIHVEVPPREFVATIERLAQVTRTAEILAETAGPDA